MHLVREVLKFTTPTDKILSNCFREHKKITSYERALIAETIYSILRNYYKLTQIAQQNIPDIVGLSWLKILNFKPSQLDNLKLIDLPRLLKLNFAATQLSKLELPQWIIDQLQQAYTESEIEQLAFSLQQAAPLDLRVNLIKNNLNEVLKELSPLGAKKMQYSPFGLRLYNKTFLAKHKLFLNGSIEVQDEASQLAGQLLNPKRGEMIADFCAGSGGKTLLFGMLMRNSGRIYALDISEERLNNLSPRLARSGLSNVYPQLINSETDAKLKRFHNKIDRVFVDAPCSGLGTLRRNPELKFRQTLSTISELNLKQASILSAASKLVKPSGYLVYATCSILPQENQQIVQQFLLKHAEFKLVPAATVIKNPAFARSDGFLVLLPHIHQCDGFFAALMQKD
ncbi:MAG: RsmB/NOP family class I SAM-dependent RNA methyltransferase [Burkholderiales bacterium]|nr:RsmB/NOP family class I SAM-dependent RNA methyltransferase [Burkholderiales bacterium]